MRQVLIPPEIPSLGHLFPFFSTSNSITVSINQKLPFYPKPKLDHSTSMCIKTYTYINYDCGGPGDKISHTVPCPDRGKKEHTVTIKSEMNSETRPKCRRSRCASCSRKKCLSTFFIPGVATVLTSG